MKFGMSLYPFARYPDQRAMLETARLADELGYEMLTIGEHVLVPREQLSTLASEWPDPLVLAGFIAGVTRRIKLFFSVLVLPYYHPVRLAKQLATLDVLSGGRVIAGVGSGWMEREFDYLGVPFAERGARTDECLRAMKALWTQDAPSFEGRWVQFDDVAFDPRPLQKPHPPIWIGGFGRNALRRAVALGDGLYPSTHGPLARIIDTISEVRGMLATAGRDPDAFSFSHAIDYGGTTRSKHASQMTKVKNLEHLAFGMDPEPILEHAKAATNAGVQCINVRIPGKDHLDVMQAMERFHRDVMSAQ